MLSAKNCSLFSDLRSPISDLWALVLYAWLLYDFLFPNYRYSMNHDCEGEHQPLVRPTAGGETATSVGSDSAGCGSEHGLREGACGDRHDHRDTRPDHATRFIETTQGTLSYAELAPLLAVRVTVVEAAILAGEYAEHPLDEWLLLDIHRRI
jgi:hypothetical protein